MKLTITGGAEAHLLAKELAAARVGVVLNPPRPFPYVWEDRRMYVTFVIQCSSFIHNAKLSLPGPPLTEQSAIAKLQSSGVTVGIGCEEIWSARNLPFDIAWVCVLLFLQEWRVAEWDEC
jgi:hypothetical protein